MMDNRVSVKNNRRIMAGSISIIAALLFLTIGCWNEYTWYEAIAPLGTVISFAALVVAFFCYVDIKEALSDRDFYIALAGCVLTLVNIFLSKSGIGAFFTAADLLIVLYLANKIQFNRKVLIGVSVYIGFYYYYWTFDVKGYFKGYNTNYGGLVLITGFAFAQIMIVSFISYLRKAGKNNAARWMMVPFLFMFVWGYNIIAWYRARCALIGLIMFVLFMIIPRKIWNRKWLYTLLNAGATLGAIAVSLLYIFLGSIKDRFTIQIFYKDILSGRDEIWGELWQAFLEHPITGIGSSYRIKLEWMGGMFEVHNGLLDILIVHGTVVFIIVVYLLLKRLQELSKTTYSSWTGQTVMAGIMAMLVASFMENFFIVPPFTLCFLILFVLGHATCETE